MNLGDFDAGVTLHFKFTTQRPSTGAPFALAGTPALSIYKDNSTTQSTSGITLTADFDSVTGLNHVTIDLSSDGTFYAAGSQFDVVITTGTVDSVSAVGFVVGRFSIRKTGLATASALATVDGIVDDILTDTGTTLPATLSTIAGYIDTEVAAIKAKTDNLPASPAAVSDIPTAAGIADAVWDEAIAGHAGSGSTGEALAAAGSAGDPWITALPGAYSAGTAGYILGTNLDAAVSSISAGSGLDAAGVRAAIGLASANLDTQLGAIDTAVDAILVDTDATIPGTLSTITGYIDTEIAAIKAKTDNLPSDPADASDIASAFGTVNTKLDTIDDFLDTEVAAIKAKTDSLTFTVAGQVDANIQYVNDVQVAGDGQSGTEWGPA